jgi:GNAT superfamily N-acetyltransferase
VTELRARPDLPSITYRAAGDADIPACAAIWRDAVNDYIIPLGQAPVPDDLTIISRLYAHLRSTDPERFVVALSADPDRPDGGRVVAFTVAVVRGTVWFLSMLFVLPEFQGRGLGRELLRQVLPAPEAGFARAIGTDSAQPISNALYSSFGIVPRMPLLNLVGLPERPDAFGELPSGVVPVASDGGRDAADALDVLDRELIGFDHAVDHRYLREQSRWAWRYHGPDGGLLGYGYSSESGRLGPILVRDPNLLGPVMGHLVEAVQPRGAFITWIPGAADRALVPALQAGLRMEPFPVLLCWDRRPIDFTRYMPISPGLL